MAELKQYKKGFEKGLARLRVVDVPSAKMELMEALGINNRISWFEYKTGKREPKISQIEAVEAVFHKYGVNEIWG